MFHPLPSKCEIMYFSFPLLRRSLNHHLIFFYKDH
uniref:Uncharacterized protein n=1 Tax=Arundo donax TaxID=35708 RepID=A0A0A8XST7_ARUDO